MQSYYFLVFTVEKFAYHASMMLTAFSSIKNRYILTDAAQGVFTNTEF